ncbi:GSCOCG00003224001-RA-CDS [Cotesia congregata]|uniref:Similar to Mybbp1A: Myb-binding protein 1A (Drosophila melanogaster) n=1 Tax=Cotesia congregata TaxID=51543 RepID=A0A8J2HQR1_COTCN|nr:GSCOCG00003224001-RA-CDS [Cotesia congregata]CAG5103183.1 Similar to Mybbp1A: Myb-binding protein 1A (Drosophila melanogaster) [Cotesia congregata]
MNSDTANTGIKPEKKMKVNPIILDSFSKLIVDNAHSRMQGEINLLTILLQLKKDDPNNEEFTYSLKRLIRGLGSSKMVSRKGFFSTLTTYLKQNLDSDIDQLIEIMEAELKLVSNLSKSERGDIYMGRILFCGSLIRSKLLFNCPVDKQQQILEILLTAGTQKSYLSFISISFLIDFIDQLDEKYIKTHFWSLLENHIGKSWTEHSLDTFYALLHISVKFPSLLKKKFLKQHLNAESIIHKDTINDLLKLVTDTPRITSYQHPLYKILSELLISSECIEDFWNGIDQRFVQPSKSMEYLALELLNHIIPNITDSTKLPSLLSSNLLNWMVGRFNIHPRYRNDDVANLFRKVLANYVLALSKPDVKPKVRITVLKTLIHYPGDLMIEKITGVKVIQSITTYMSLNGLKKLAKFYTAIVDDSEPKKAESKEKSWSNAERNYACQLLCKLLGQPAVNADLDWKHEQLTFLFNFGMCEIENVNEELASHIKDSFYRALDHKQKLPELYALFDKLVRYINTELFVNKILTLRTPLDDSAIEAWKKMMKFVKKTKDDSRNNEVNLIFHVMDLNMGLQIFIDPTMAISSINEIHICYEKLKQKKSKKKSKKIEDEEPEWVDVIVDFLLSLLSQSNHLLRSLVQRVFPHLCPVLTATSVHRILEVLDPKDDKGPLVPEGTENDSSDDESNSEDEDSDNNSEKMIKKKSVTKNSVEENEDDDDDEDEDDDDFDEEDEDETINDRLRMAVRQALGSASANPDVNDIDLDEIDEEEGKRLDESLAAAFKILRESRPNKKKQEKSAEALTHFRVRVIDLLDIYIDSGPSMALVLDMLVPLFALLEFCIKDVHQEPLEGRVRSCLKKLSSVKKFKDTEGVDEKLLTDLATILIEKGERSAAVCQEMGDKLAECYALIIKCFQQTDLPQDSLVKIYIDCLKKFFKKRDCILPANLFKNTLNLLWTGNWQLMPLLIDYAFDNTIRSYRRSQALEFMIIFYHNHRLMKSEEDSNLRLNIEKKLCKNTVKLFQELTTHQDKYNNECSKTDNDVTSKELRQKFVGLLWTLLSAIYPHQLPKAWNWKSIALLITEYREKNSFSKDAKTAYKKLASQIGAPINVTTKIKEQKKEPMKNGTLSKDFEKENEEVEELNDEKSSEENDKVLVKKLKKELKKQLKNRSKKGDKQKLKKEARELRAKLMSEGLETVNFSSVVIPEEIIDDEPMETAEPTENGISKETRKNKLIEKSSKKRTHTGNERSNKSKKKKHV